MENATSGASAARSTQITIVNGTKYELEYLGSELQHGVWNGGPVETVNPHTVRVVAQNDSDGLMTGAQGWLAYKVVDFKHVSDQRITLFWDNPFKGDNSYSCNNDTASDLRLYLNYCRCGKGDNAEISFILCEAADY